MVAEKVAWRGAPLLPAYMAYGFDPRLSVHVRTQDIDVSPGVLLVMFRELCREFIVRH